MVLSFPTYWGGGIWAKNLRYLLFNYHQTFPRKIADMFRIS